MTQQHSIEWLLRHGASPDLVVVFTRSIERARDARTDVYLANVVLELLNDATVRARVSSDSRLRASFNLSNQLVTVPSVATAYNAPRFAFELIRFLGPAHALAIDCGTSLITPITFLATCLVSDLSVDEVSRRTQEEIRSAGITTESLMPIPKESETIRQDFRYKSLGFGIDLTAMALSGCWVECPLVGMCTQMRTLAKLLNSGVGSAVLVGEPGVGKSALVQGLAYKIAQRDRHIIPSTMDGWTVVMIEAADVLQNTTFQGELERRVKEMLAHFTKTPTVIPFFEEIHRLLDTEDQSTRRIAAAFKPPMASGTFRCVGATSEREYGRFIAHDRALDSRFRKILIIAGFTVDVNGNESPDGDAPIREDWIYGAPGSNASPGVTLQVDGTLAIGSNLAPIVAINASCSPQSVVSYVKTAPTGAGLTCNVNVGGTLWMTLTIPAGAESVVSTSAQLAAAGTIAGGAGITLDITAVGTTVPGADLSVFIYL